MGNLIFRGVVKACTGSSANMDIPVTNWDEYLSGCDLGDNVNCGCPLKHSFSIHSRCVHSKTGENCRANDQLA